MAIGVPSYHRMDWAGSNVHYVALPNQTVQEAGKWLFDHYESEEQAVTKMNKKYFRGTWFNGEGTLSLDWKSRTIKKVDYFKNPPTKETWNIPVDEELPVEVSSKMKL